MKKMLVSDFDNTFYINFMDTYSNINLIKKFRNTGNIFIMATGRSLQDFKSKLDIYPVEFDYLICNHGSVIFDRNFKTLYYKFINNTAKDLILNYINNNNNIISKTLYSVKENNVNEKDDLTKIRIVLDNLYSAKFITNYINTKFAGLVNAYLFMSDNFIEIVSSDVDKSVAIKKVSEILNIDNISVIGDNYNDMPMIKAFAGFCVSIALDEVKKISKKEYNSVSNLILELLDE